MNARSMTADPARIAGVALFGFGAVELVLRRGSSARSWRRTAFDRGSTVLILVAYGVTGACLFRPFPGPYFPEEIRWASAIVALGGLALRVIAFRTLGRSYSRTLRVTDGQPLVTHGVYRWIRHPGYLSAILIWGGAAMASGSALATATAWAALCIAYAYRIRTEETMLADGFGAPYDAYRRTSWRLVPYVW